jgi:uncharacterized membrane protein
MSATYEARVVSQSVDVPAHEVYRFASQMENLPQWASGLAAGIEHDGNAWFAQSPMGRVRIEMAATNTSGVLDHDVTLPDGTRVHNALRVTPCGPGSLLTFVVLRLPGVAQDAFEADVAHVQSDLLALKTLLEGRTVT